MAYMATWLAPSNKLKMMNTSRVPRIEKAHLGTPRIQQLDRLTYRLHREKIHESLKLYAYISSLIQRTRLTSQLSSVSQKRMTVDAKPLNFEA